MCINTAALMYHTVRADTTNSMAVSMSKAIKRRQAPILHVSSALLLLCQCIVAQASGGHHDYVDTELNVYNTAKNIRT